MELKWASCYHAQMWLKSSNRTFMELKCGYVAYVAKHG